jgi:phosphate transport system substrate-binding protein
MKHKIKEAIYMSLVRRVFSAHPRSLLVRLSALALLGLLATVVVACGDDEKDTTGGTAPAGSPTEAVEELSGSIEGDGSSTVFPITEAVVEEFRKVQPDVDIVVGISGTGGGFERFCNGETDFSNASRKIKDPDEVEACAAGSVEYTEFEVAYDGLSVVVNPSNDFAECLTVEELAAIWAPDSAVDSWNDVRADFPDQPITLYGPGTDSGTFDYFTAEIVGEEGASRSDYTASEDDNVLVQGVAGDENALGYFGYAYYEQNQDQLKVIGVDEGSGCVTPSVESVRSGDYAPLSRPLYVYVSDEALASSEVEEFIRFFLTEGPALAEEVGYVAAPDASYDEGLAKLE